MSAANVTTCYAAARCSLFYEMFCSKCFRYSPMSLRSSSNHFEYFEFVCVPILVEMMGEEKTLHGRISQCASRDRFTTFGPART